SMNSVTAWSLCCSTADEDEDEVFVGPVSHKERCVSQAVASRLQSEGVQASWSPLTGEQLDAICQEAHKLANELQSSEPAGGTAADTEDFIQDGEAKLGVLDPAARVLSPVKRETFCVQDSPMKLLPPAVQRQVLRGSGSRAARASCSAPARPALRGKAAMGGSAVLPNKLPAMHSSGSASRGRMERTRLQPPSKVACGSKRSPTSRRSTRSQSCEDLLSDTESVTSNLSDSSVGSCTSGKRVMAPPTKTVGVRSTSGGKAPPLQNRRNTSSSSSSVSSFNSSTSLSPAQGWLSKVGSSLNCSLSGGPGPAPGSVPRAANPGQARRSTVEPPRPATAGRRSLSTHPRRSLLKRADSTVPKPKRLMSLSSLDSLPQKPSAGPLTPSAGGCASLQVKARRPSALPTPVRRRVSAIPSPRPTLTSSSPAGCSSSGSAASRETAHRPNQHPGSDQDRRQDCLRGSGTRRTHVVKEPLSGCCRLISDGFHVFLSLQLIDLSSPLIKWSPEEKGENTAPLINLSF
uniref:G2 and S phase-expressed protein 1 N-terminal domain-containing protein n=1 Tax=Salarias fasciatus TaxID=181472 RepID=A0A672IZV1_SALFA